VRRLVLIFALASLVVTAQDRRIAPADRGRRMALVIGNNDYPWKPLRNAVNDAQAVANLLPQLGFQPADITLATNTKLKDLQRAARGFMEKLRSDDVAFVYYSGHGIEIRGENYLVPVDFPANATELEARDEAYSAQQLLRSLEDTNARVRLIILDACRDNPLRPTRSGAGGLARMDGQGTLIVFATGAGQTADDNVAASNGLFTSYLLKALPTPGVPIDQLIKQVARDVHRVRDIQTPAVYGLLYEDFTFVPGKATSNSNTTCGDAWAMVKDSTDSSALTSFTRDFGECASEVRLARLRLTTLAPPPLDSTRPKANPKDNLTYVWIPPGRFKMGCDGDGRDYGEYNNGNPCRKEWGPAHDVRITKGFWLGQTEVTQLAYKRVTGQDPNEHKGNDLPVESTSWDEAAGYCRAIGGRLPTEAEWEYAARGGNAADRYGDLDDIAWHFMNSDGNKPHPVGLKAANVYGLYDMLGSLWEWTADWYADQYYRNSPPADPKGPASGTEHTTRGGSQFNPENTVRATYRAKEEVGKRSPDIGFRCVWERP
jgi:formylglycine-generating enzyme